MAAALLGHPNTPTKPGSSNSVIAQERQDQGLGASGGQENPGLAILEQRRQRQTSPFSAPLCGGLGIQEEVEAGQQRCLGVFAVMFCGMAGFSDFYKLRWLEAILGWQNPQVGCFGKPGELPVCPSWEHCLVGSQFLGHSRKGCPGIENWWFRPSKHTHGCIRDWHSESHVGARSQTCKSSLCS